MVGGGSGTSGARLGATGHRRKEVVGIGSLLHGGPMSGGEAILFNLINQKLMSFNNRENPLGILLLGVGGRGGLT